MSKKHRNKRTELFVVADIRKLFESRDVTLNPRGALYLKGVANARERGGLRRCSEIFKLAVKHERKILPGRRRTRFALSVDQLRVAESMLRVRG